MNGCHCPKCRPLRSLPEVVIQKLRDPDAPQPKPEYLQRAEHTGPLSPTDFATDSSSLVKQTFEERIDYLEGLNHAIQGRLTKLQDEFSQYKANHEAYVSSVRQVFQTRFKALGDLAQLVRNRALNDQQVRELADTMLGQLTPMPPAS